MKHALLFAPHNDDETLFAFFHVMRYRPQVIVCLRSYRQWTHGGPSYITRETETLCAMPEGVNVEQWAHSDLEPKWDIIANDIYDALMHRAPEIVIAPAFEMGGHEDHNAIASIVAGIEGDWHLIRYYTYERGHGRTTKGTPVEYEEGWPEAKLEALACYRTQIARPDCSPWFPGGAYFELGEWIA